MPVKGPEKYTAKYWHDQITNAEDRYKTFCDRAKQSIEVYNTKHKIDEVERRINCWWSLVNTMLPAYYSSTPKAQVELKKKAGTQAHSLAAVALERCTQWEMDEGFDFDQVGLDSALHFLLTGIGVLWARYEANISKKEVRLNLIRTESGLITPDGKLWKGKETEVEEATDGSLTCCQEYEAKEGERAILELVNYDDFRCSDARNVSEIEWKARRAWLCEEEAEEIFGKDIAGDLSYDSFPESFKRDVNAGNKDEYNGKAELWEIHCEESGKVYWLQAKGEKSVLQEDEPRLKFEDFYPCVEIRSSTDPLSIIPVSDYEHAKDQILLCERLTSRKHALIQSIRTNFGFDATMPELADFFTGDLKGIPVKNWPSYKGRGGLASAMEFQDPTPYVNALQIVSEQEAAAWDKLCEMTKCSDLLRGQTDPTKTATANRLENAWSSLGLIVRQNQFANFIGRAVGKVGTIIAQAYSPERIAEISDLKGLIQPLAADPMQAQTLEQEVLGIIKNAEEMAFRIEIASDSMVCLNERQERQDAVDLIQSSGAFFQQMQQMIEQYPPLITLGIQLFQFIVRRYRGGKELEPIFIDALQKTGQMAQQKQEAAQQQPPDPAMIAAQTQMQIAQMDAQTQQQKSMADFQIAQAKEQREAAAMQFEQLVKSRELELKTQELSLAQMELQAKIGVDQQRLQLDQQQAATQTAKDVLQMQIDKHMQQVDAMIRQQEADTKDLAAKLNTWETIQEERRLAQVELGTKTKEPKQPIQIINQIPAPKNKKITKLKNADGSETYKSEEAED